MHNFVISEASVKRNTCSSSQAARGVLGRQPLSLQRGIPAGQGFRVSSVSPCHPQKMATTWCAVLCFPTFYSFQTPQYDKALGHKPHPFVTVFYQWGSPIGHCKSLNVSFKLSVGLRIPPWKTSRTPGGPQIPL